ncbi:hypothetical protein AVEN_200154-1 [Araneus ventricosus]|uniref:Uncharacterized protein n=1 Tax=Araneus ventricosus TaxID=182803 RepID=A0A4Y2R0T9_ARAVE|nr:hypothetical protein AVEN_238089-1 [Araneus ventricosus]GBN69106.1 hypothetical protein AVEN_11875-1 [Araneus ventricosus]GBN69150.1 hypothetical protein AVEN_176860-1 [Araneus ventricosus]GBN69166.1 hypothetical protein AVEN_200154-1 [Araneus ventricosus]
MVIDMEHHFRETEDLPKEMKLFNRKKDPLNEKVNIHKDLKKKSSPTDEFDILRLFRKTGTLSKEKVENFKEQLCFIPDKHKRFYEHVLHENPVDELI